MTEANEMLDNAYSWRVAQYGDSTKQFFHLELPQYTWVERLVVVYNPDSADFRAKFFGLVPDLPPVIYRDRVAQFRTRRDPSQRQ